MTFLTPHPALTAYLDSFDLVLRVGGRSARTREMYGDIARWFAGWLTGQGVTRWADVGRKELRQFFLHCDELGYAKSYRNNIGRCLQAFHKFLADEEDRPALGEPNLDVADVDVKDSTATVTGKGGKVRTVKFDHKAALAVDRYLRKRGEHRAAGLPALWLGERRDRRMTPSGVRQMVERRGEALGLDIHPHLFRHTFSHNWLDAGGAEGDLMQLNGWESPQMLRHYGASARGARARRAYDRIDVMAGSDCCLARTGARCSGTPASAETEGPVSPRGQRHGLGVTIAEVRAPVDG